MKKINNSHKILQYIILNKKVSRADISRKFGLNKATVSYIISELENKEIIKPCEELKITKGRHSVLYKLNESYGSVFSINLKPQSAQYCVCDLNGKKLFENAKPLDISTETKLTNSLISIISELLNQFPNNIGILIGIHGIVDSNEIIKFTPFSSITNFNLKNSLIKSFPDAKIFINNEANITAFGESQNYLSESIVTISNSKGIGLGMITNHNIYNGADGFAGEIGHTIVVPNGEQCACGNIGCLELYASEENIFSKASKIKGYEINNKEFLDLYNKNDKEIKEIYLQSLDYLYISLNNTITLLNPSKIILNSYLYVNINDTLPYLRNKLSTRKQNTTEILISEMYENAFSIGSASYVVNKIFIENINL